MIIRTSLAILAVGMVASGQVCTDRREKPRATGTPGPRLERVADQGIISVESEPEGAKIIVNKREAKSKTNVSFYYPVGRVLIRVIKSGYLPAEFSAFQLTETQPKECFIKLIKQVDNAKSYFRELYRESLPSQLIIKELT